VGRALKTLNDGKQLITGVTFSGDSLYVTRESAEEVEVYDRDVFHSTNTLRVPGLGYSTDIVFCPRNRCCYICDGRNNCIQRLSLCRTATESIAYRKADFPSRWRATRHSEDDTAMSLSKWPVNDEPAHLSVTAEHSVLVTCSVVRKIKEFTADGELIRELQLPESVTSPEHTIRLSSGQFIVCHGGFGDPIHRVCLIGRDGQVVRLYGEPKGSGSQQMDSPTHLAVDRKGYVFVADLQNCRVLLLSPSLAYIREIVSRDQLKGGYPVRLCLDPDTSLLYVAVSDGPRGRLLVASV